MASRTAHASRRSDPSPCVRRSHLHHSRHRIQMERCSERRGLQVRFRAFRRRTRGNMGCHSNGIIRETPSSGRAWICDCISCLPWADGLYGSGRKTRIPCSTQGPGPGGRMVRSDSRHPSTQRHDCIEATCHEEGSVGSLKE